MKPSIKEKLRRTLSHNRKLDKKALQIKSSWDQVANMISAKEKRRK